MGYTIAVSGKGGTGKTTIAALIIRLLKEKNAGSILAVDADPNSNLGEVLGIKPQNTIGSILDDLLNHQQYGFQGMSKDRFIEYQVQSAIQETENFDILTMGRPEGQGCYCYVNNVLRNIMGKLIGDYKYIVIDNEAGLEHFSRRTTQYADALIVVSHDNPVGFKAAKRIQEIIREVGIKIQRSFLIINCSERKIKRETLQNMDLDYLGNIPQDDQINRLSLDGESLIGLDNDSVSLNALRKIGDKVWG